MHAAGLENCPFKKGKYEMGSFEDAGNRSLPQAIVWLKCVILCARRKQLIKPQCPLTGDGTTLVLDNLLLNKT